MESGEDVGPIRWEEFKSAFLEWCFPLELSVAKIQRFINLYKGIWVGGSIPLNSPSCLGMHLL